MGVPSVLASLALLVASAIADPLSLLQVGLQTASGDLKTASEPLDGKESSATPEPEGPSLVKAKGIGDSFCGYDPQGGSMSVLLSPSGQDFLVELSDAFAESDTIHVMSTAMSISGNYKDGSGYSNIYANPLEQTHSQLFMLKVSADKTEVEVYMPQMEVRSTDDQMAEALKRGIGSSFLGSFATLACMGAQHQLPFNESDIAQLSMKASFSIQDPAKHMGDVLPMLPPHNLLRTRETATAGERIVINGKDLVAQGFFVAPQLGSSQFKLLKAASFPSNIAVSTEFNTYSGNAQVGFSMIILPDEPMQPRVADDRLLYFTSDYTDLGTHKLGQHERPVSAADRKLSVIWRYDLATLPNNTIRIYVDPSVPARWRQYFREGVEQWNDAFASAGKPNAVRGVCPEDSDWPSDYDVSDARFSTISWSVSDQVVSMGIAKVDPRSGQIIKSDIIMADGWIKAWLGDLDILDPNVTYVLDEQNRFHTETRSRSQTGGSAELPFSTQPRSGLQLGTSLSLLTLGAKAQSEEEEENIIGQGLRQIVMHEAGHILGLRHNFKGSMGVSYACTQDITCSAVHGLTASVMDYLPMNLAEKGSGPVHAFSPVVGAYDKAVIQYGYMDADDKTAMESHTRPTELMAVVEKAEGFQTCYDGDANAQDPSCMRYDATGSPLRYFEATLDRIVERQRDVLMHVMPGGSYKNFGNTVHSLLYKAGNTGLDLMEWIGGMNNTYAHRGLDGQNRGVPSRAPMPVELQRKALSLLLRLLRPAENGFLPRPEDMKYLVEGKMLDEVQSQDLSYDIRHIANVLLSHLLSTSQVMRVHAQERYALEGGSLSGETYSAGEFLSTVESYVFTQGLDSVSSDDWNIQEYFITNLLDLYKDSGIPSPIKAQILVQVERVDQLLVAALNHLEARSEQLLLVARESSVSPSKDELLQAHLLGLHTKLFGTVCAASANCILPALVSSQVTGRRLATPAEVLVTPLPPGVLPSGAQTTVPASAALMGLALALGTQLFG